MKGSGSAVRVTLPRMLKHELQHSESIVTSVLVSITTDHYSSGEWPSQHEPLTYMYANISI